MKVSSPLAITAWRRFPGGDRIDEVEKLRSDAISKLGGLAEIDRVGEHLRRGLSGHLDQCTGASDGVDVGVEVVDSFLRRLEETERLGFQCKLDSGARRALQLDQVGHYSKQVVREGRDVARP